MNIEEIVSKIKTAKQNSDYRVADILNGRGYRWKHSLSMVLQKPEYAESILKDHATSSSNINDSGSFYSAVLRYADRTEANVPQDDEVVIHLRMGDVVETEWFLKDLNTSKERLLSAVDRILSENTISKITIVTCFSYQVWSPDSMHLKPEGVSDWSYSDEKQKINIDVMQDIIGSMCDRFDVPVDVVSSEKADDDIVYCTMANYFIPDVRFSNLNKFTGLLLQLNNIHLRN